MKYGSLILEKREYVFLKRILNISGYADDHEVQKSLIKLSNELKTATIVDQNKVPKDVVRFNSIVSIKSSDGWDRKLQVVMPVDKNPSLNKVSVLAPMGAALFGYSKDDTVVWEFSTGIQKLKIIDVKTEESLTGINIMI